eukprot:scaffold3886_cov399-Prasinococcus_capsulatus_cf.AAC.41
MEDGRNGALSHGWCGAGHHRELVAHGDADNDAVHMISLGRQYAQISRLKRGYISRHNPVETSTSVNYPFIGFRHPCRTPQPTKLGSYTLSMVWRAPDGAAPNGAAHASKQGDDNKKGAASCGRAANGGANPEPREGCGGCGSRSRVLRSTARAPYTVARPPPL